ncbi:MAG: glycosyltransferase family 2 protein [Alphaproteobacteria bacterium]|nr:glycosyltransferase family 2 protein [Alphaproteobacteria bacterium]
MQNTELSIIIPAYNAQDYIVRCVESIMRQRGADRHEIIIVDDGSTDNTPKTLDAIAEIYKNIRVIHQKNESRPF